MPRYRILIATPELATLAPVGGIAEYVLGLAAALKQRGHDVRIALPAFAYLANRAEVTMPRLVTPLGVGATEVWPVSETRVPCPGDKAATIPVSLVGAHIHFATIEAPAQIYAWPNHEPWVAFSRAVVELTRQGRWKPDIIHCQDAHTSVIPVYVRQARAGSAASLLPKTVLTIHNLLNQGRGPRALVAYAGLDDTAFERDGFEFYGGANCMKAGLLAADRVSTVSSTYAREIRASAEFGFGLEGVLASLPSLAGIVNGIDEHRWRADGIDYERAAPADIACVKQRVRTPLYASWRWEPGPDPVIAFRSRWDRQKGVLLLAECLPEIVERARAVLCVWGTPGQDDELQRAWKRITALASSRPDRLLINPAGISTVDQTAAHYAVADMFLMPSVYEPCGLTQMECQRYGTVPIVRRTGGLADTVVESPAAGGGAANGFVFDEMSRPALLAAVERARHAFAAPAIWDGLVQSALHQKNGWQTRVAQYESLFAGLVAK